MSPFDDAKNRETPFLRPVASGFEGCPAEPDNLLSPLEIKALEKRLAELRAWRARSEVSARDYVIF